jgi:hypothetical protein
VVFAAVIEGRAVPGGIFRAQAGQLKMLVGAETTRRSAGSS